MRIKIAIVVIVLVLGSVYFFYIRRQTPIISNVATSTPLQSTTTRPAEDKNNQPKTNQNMEKNQINNTAPQPAYALKIGEVASYIDHPLFSVGDITIKYLGSTGGGIDELDQYIYGDDKFEVTGTSGKKINIDRHQATAIYPPPAYIITSNGCYELHINSLDQDGTNMIPGKLLVNKLANDKCSALSKAVTESDTLTGFVYDLR